MNWIGRITGIVGTLLCTGCSMLDQSMRPAPLVEYPVMNYQAVNIDTGQVGPLTSAFSSTEVPILSREVIEVASKSPTYRDWAQDALLQRSDVLCAQYLDGLYNMVTRRKLALTEITTIANAIGTLSTTTSVTRAMNFVGTISSGTNANFDSEILQSQLITLIITQIKRNREQILGLIMEARNKPYSLSLAIRDAERYHQQCSFIAAMTGLTEQAQKASPSSQPQSNAVSANVANATAAKAQSTATTGK